MKGLRVSCPWLASIFVVLPRGQKLPEGVAANGVRFHDELCSDQEPLPSFAPGTWITCAARAVHPHPFRGLLVVPPTCVLRGPWSRHDFFTPDGRPVVHVRRRRILGIVPVRDASLRSDARLLGDPGGNGREAWTALAKGALRRSAAIAGLDTS